MSKFQTIGGAWENTSKTGKKYLSIKVDEGVFEHILKEDFQKSMCLFTNDRKTNEKSPSFTLSCAMPDDFISKYNKEKPPYEK